MNRSRSLVLVALVAVSVASCVTWNGQAYQRLANDELLTLARTPDDVPLDPNRCLALNLGALSLWERDGGSKSLNAPFFSGQHVDRMAAVHQRQSRVCAALLRKEEAGELTPELRARARAAWSTTWRNGRELLGASP